MNLNFSANMAGFCRDSHICTLKDHITILLILHRAPNPPLGKADHLSLAIGDMVLG